MTTGTVGSSPVIFGAGFVDDDVDEVELAPAGQGFVAAVGSEPARVADLDGHEVAGELVAGDVE